MPRTKKNTGPGKALMPVDEPTRDVAHRMEGSGELVRVDAIYNVPSVHPAGVGPWQHEADKIAWTDEMSGYPCIIRRSRFGGHLCGYVAVPPGHPLFGLKTDLLVGFDIDVHGGLTYAAACQHWEPERKSICHVGSGVAQQLVHANRAAVERGRDDAWWLGFECDRPGDVKPGFGDDFRRSVAHDGIHAWTYKDEGYVHRECVRLAAQLRAITDGEDPREADPGSDFRSSVPRGKEG